MRFPALDKRFRVMEIPIVYAQRPSGSYSKLRTFRDGARVLLTIASVFRHYRPLAFFTASSLLAGVLGLVAAVPVLLDWFRYRFIFHVPLAILTASLEVVAVVSMGVALIFDSIAYQQRLAFERELLNAPTRESFHNRLATRSELPRVAGQFVS